MATRSCSDNEIDKQRKAAKDAGYRHSFAPTTVHVESVDAAQQLVTYTAKGSAALNAVRWTRPDVWTECPSSVGSDSGGLPSPGDDGTLYLSEPCFRRLEASAQQHTRVKWPEELAAPDAYVETALAIKQLIVHYATQGSSEVRRADLSRENDPNEVLDLRGVYTTLKLRKGDAVEAVRANILRIDAHADANENGEAGDVDLMNPGLADTSQILKLGNRGSVSVRLSQRGRHRFLLGTHPVAGGETATFASSPRPGAPAVITSKPSGILTFLAKPPTQAPATAGAAAPGDLAIDEVKQHLAESGSPYVEVSSLVEIARVLRERKAASPHTIQIVGHGSPGMLALGYYWNHQYTDTDAGPFYLLDSNPYAYGVLDELVPRDTLVLLVGCEVGSNHSAQFVARGGALIYDLHAMWGCDVLGADQLVGPRDFVRGRFVGSAQGYVRGRWVRSAGLAATSTNQLVVDRPEPLPYQNIQLTAIPALGAARPSALPTIDSRPLERYTSEVRLASPLLAMPEVSFSATATHAPDETVALHLIANGLLLQAVRKTESATHVRYFAVDDRDDSPHTRLYGSPSQKIWAEIKTKLADAR